MKIYLQTTADRNVWEKGDEFIRKNWKTATTEDGKPRYTGNIITITDDGKHEINATDLTMAEMTIVARILQVTPRDAAYAGGFLRDPAVIFFQPKNPKQPKTARLADGSIYRQVTAAK